MNAGCLGTREGRERVVRHQRERLRSFIYLFIYIYIYFPARQEPFNIGSGVARCESGEENACGIRIRLMSNKKQGVGVIWGGNNGE